MVEIFLFVLRRTKHVVTQKREEIVPTERNKFNVHKERVKSLK